MFALNFWSPFSSGLMVGTGRPYTCSAGEAERTDVHDNQTHLLLIGMNDRTISFEKKDIRHFVPLDVAFIAKIAGRINPSS